jgi:ParB family chromosome partitioning protein
VPKPKRGLGRGLDALIPGSEASTGLTEADVNDIVPNPRQPRHDLNPEGLLELAASIREHGLIQPLIVTRVESDAILPGQMGGPQYQLIAGERRWQAAKMAGMDRVPVVIKDVTPQETLELALVENIQRADLNPLEEAGAYLQLAEEFGLTQEQIAERVGRSRSAVANSLRLLGLPEDIKVPLADGRISEGHARAMLGLDGVENQLLVLHAILDRNLSVRQTEELVRRLSSLKAEKPKPVQKVSSETAALENAFRSALGTKVNLLRSKKGGKLVIHFYSEEELQQLYDVLVGE